MIKPVTIKQNKNGFGSTYDEMSVNKTMALIFPDYNNDPGRDYNGIRFDSISTGGGWHRHTIGVNMYFYSSDYKTVRRGVKLTKDGLIDDVKVKAKYEELLVLLAEDKEKEKEKDAKDDAKGLVRDKVVEAMEGVKVYNIHSYSVDKARVTLLLNEKEAKWIATALKVRESDMEVYK